MSDNVPAPPQDAVVTLTLDAKTGHLDVNMRVPNVGVALDMMGQAIAVVGRGLQPQPEPSRIHKPGMRLPFHFGGRG